MIQTAASGIFVSDIHILEPGDRRTQLLLDLLERALELELEYFVLLGDIFDFCFGASPYFKKKFSEVGAALTRLARKGTRVLYIQGNHEFSVDCLGWEGVEFVTEKTREIVFSDGKRVCLTHGDRLLAPWHYHLYLRITRSALFRTLALCLPQARLDRFALRMSSYSRQSSSGAAFDTTPLFAAAQDWVQECEADWGLFGHYHAAYQVELAPERGFLCFPSWSRPNLLSYENGGFARYWLENEGRYERLAVGCSAR